MTTIEAWEIAWANGSYQKAFSLGAIAGREGRPKCLDNGGTHQDKDNATIQELADRQFALVVVLGNAWMAGYKATTPQELPL